MEEINILVICSNPNGVDFNFPQNQELIKKMCNKDIKYDFIDVKYNDKKYQEEIFNFGEKTYDIIWFAGCNMLNWLFDTNNVQSIIQQIKYILRPNGKIIFTESPNYVKVYSAKPYNKYLTVPIENLGTHSNKINGFDNSDILQEWNSNFLLNYSPTTNPEYQYYTILDTKGGKNKFHKNKFHKNKSHKNKSRKNKSRKNKSKC